MRRRKKRIDKGKTNERKRGEKVIVTLRKTMGPEFAWHIPMFLNKLIPEEGVV